MKWLLFAGTLTTLSLVALHDLGEHELRDLSGAERVDEVRRPERKGSVPAPP